MTFQVSDIIPPNIIRFLAQKKLQLKIHISDFYMGLNIDHLELPEIKFNMLAFPLSFPHFPTL